MAVLELGLSSRTMPAQQLRCEVWVIPEGDPTGENAVECRAIALACADCGESAGCEEHALLCPSCRKPVCEYCADEHSCIVKQEQTRAA